MSWNPWAQWWAPTAVNLNRRVYTTYKIQQNCSGAYKNHMRNYTKSFLSNSVFQWHILLQDTQRTCSQQRNCREEEIKTGNEVSLWKTLWHIWNTRYYEINCFLFDPHVRYFTMLKLDKPLIKQRLYLTQHMQHITNNHFSHHHHIDLTKQSVKQSRLTTNISEVTFKWW